jgi:hypothetical protein
VALQFRSNPDEKEEHCPYSSQPDACQCSSGDMVETFGSSGAPIGISDCKLSIADWQHRTPGPARRFDTPARESYNRTMSELSEPGELAGMSIEHRLRRIAAAEPGGAAV